jgi:hypothetical protein
VYLARIEVGRSWILSVSGRGGESGGWYRGLGVSLPAIERDAMCLRDCLRFSICS